MASLIGKVAGSVATMYTENSLALANLNLDFTLVKLEVPQEFSSVALAMSKKRKIDAEEGALHRTARKLGALFQSSLPPTQALFRAYGRRVSEISAMPVVNPKSTDRNNMFAGQIGLDTASIWAAATSGAGAIAVHLLACMISRMFTSSEATSIWVEIVEKQRENIFKDRDEAIYNESYDGLIIAAKQEIPRSDLANWDASARAWLQSADQAKERQHKQMMLILNNASIPISNEPDTYKSVMKAWTTALRAMENLVNGMPQQVQDGAALLGISSWHMYPDILLFGETAVDVKQKDDIFENTAVLTLGLEVPGDPDKSVSWSLPLARLQYYGDPVHISRTAGPDNSRITPDQFSWVILGCLFETWRSFAPTTETALSWLEQIMTLVRVPLTTAMSAYRDQFSGASWYGTMWLEYLDVAAQKLATYDGFDKQLAWQLVSLGRRKSTFLYPANQCPVPLFGLLSLKDLIPMIRTDELRLELLQKMASRRKLSTTSFIIRYKASNSPCRIEYATVRPIKWNTSGHEDESRISRKHVRWLPVRVRELEEICARQDASFRDTSPLWRRHDHLTNEGNICFPVLEEIDHDTVVPRSMYGYSIDIDFLTAAEALLYLFSQRKPRPGIEPRVIAGCKIYAAIYQIARSNNGVHVPTPLQPQAKDMEGIFTLEKLEVKSVVEYLVYRRGDQREIIPLKACTAASNMFSRFPNATISTLVLTRDIRKGKWVNTMDLQRPILKLSRAQAFACIAMFETGICNLDPSSLLEVFAISSGNSLFVANALLVDPHEAPDSSDIRRMVGNIGRAGLSLLIPPARPKIRHADLGSWKEINHVPFHGDAEDNFQNNSIHLSFTEYEMPFRTLEGDSHTIDRPINLIETLVSVYEGGRWVADLDALKALSMYPFDRYRLSRQLCDRSEATLTRLPVALCKHRPTPTFLEASKTFPALRSICIDNWEELLDPPKNGTIIIRAHGNWLARLALTVVCVNSGLNTILLGNEPCWSCCGELLLSIYASIKLPPEFPVHTDRSAEFYSWRNQDENPDSEEDSSEQNFPNVASYNERYGLMGEEEEEDNAVSRDCSDESLVDEGLGSHNGEISDEGYSDGVIALIY